MNTKRRIGVIGLEYPQTRNILSLPVKGYEFVRARDLFSGLGSLRRRLHAPANATSVISCLHYDFGFTRVALFHLFNSISYSPTPWVVSFEHFLPRWNMYSERGMKLLASDKCKKIIAISRYAFDFQNHYLPSRSDWKGAIAGKMCILHPAQDILVRDYSEKQLDTEFITFTFAGHDFFRKGGKEILLVIDRLVNEHYPVKLNIVSRLGYGDYASMSTEQDRQRAEALIDKLRNHVTYYAVLPNSEVLNLFRRSHVSLLATYDDTYGFVVLESQAAGCPVISTDVCALPEINDNAVGWLIELPKDGDRIALMHTAEERSRLSSIIQERLYSIIKEICLKPHMIREKGIRSIEKTKRDYSPTQRADVLERIYGEALGSAS